jgi:hypothetical protein
VILTISLLSASSNARVVVTLLSARTKYHIQVPVDCVLLFFAEASLGQLKSDSEWYGGVMGQMDSKIWVGSFLFLQYFFASHE